LKTGLILASIDPLHRHVQVNKIFSTGAVAQLGERRVRNAKVGSSILLRSTKFSRHLREFFLNFLSISPAVPSGDVRQFTSHNRPSAVINAVWIAFS
jgi:hypothetical protein